jgi:plastocyanin
MLALLTAATAVVMGLPVVASAQVTADYTVLAGFEVPHGFSPRVAAPLDHGVPTINIEKDDIINLVGGGLILPEGTGPFEWQSENTHELDSPYGLIASDPDGDLTDPFVSDAPYKFNIGPIDTPTTADCGSSADAPCVVDGTSAFNGGDRFATSEAGDFFFQVTANPGTTLWVTSPFGYNRLVSLKINVVANGVTTQSAIDTAADEIIALETDNANALHAKLSKASTSHNVNGHKVWDAYAGYDTATFALLDFYPTKLKIKKGDKVRWHFSSLDYEQHGLAFPLASAKDIAANGFLPVCDPDGDGAGADGPDTFVDFETFTCPDGTEMEFDLSRDMTAKAGDGRYPGGNKKVENSGLRGANIPSAPGLAGGTDPWDLTFTKASSAKGYKYICTFHGGFMSAFVVVQD